MTGFHRRIVLAGAFLVLILSIWSAAAQDWPQWRGPGRNGNVVSFQEPKTWPEQLTQKWQVKVGIGHSSPLLIGSRIFVFARQEEQEGKDRGHPPIPPRDICSRHAGYPYVSVKRPVRSMCGGPGGIEWVSTIFSPAGSSEPAGERGEPLPIVNSALQRRAAIGIAIRLCRGPSASCVCFGRCHCLRGCRHDSNGSRVRYRRRKAPAVLLKLRY